MFVTFGIRCPFSINLGSVSLFRRYFDAPTTMWVCGLPSKTMLESSILRLFLFLVFFFLVFRWVNSLFARDCKSLSFQMFSLGQGFDSSSASCNYYNGSTIRVFRTPFFRLTALQAPVLENCSSRQLANGFLFHKAYEVKHFIVLMTTSPTFSASSFSFSLSLSTRIGDKDPRRRL